MIKKLVICLNYGHFEKKMRSVIVSQNHYLKKILDVHPLRNYMENIISITFKWSNHVNIKGTEASEK